MQWQTNLPLIAILRGITPDEALAHVGAVIDAGFDAVEIPLNSPQWEKKYSAGRRRLRRAGAYRRGHRAATGAGRQAGGHGLSADCDAKHSTGSDPASGGLRHDRVSGLRHRQRSL